MEWRIDVYNDISVCVLGLVKLMIDVMKNKINLIYYLVNTFNDYFCLHCLVLL